MNTTEAVEKLLAVTEDLRVALRKGWLNDDGDDGLDWCCNYCDERVECVEYDSHVHGYDCKHTDDCLMTKHAKLVGNVNDPSED